MTSEFSQNQESFTDIFLAISTGNGHPFELYIKNKISTYYTQTEYAKLQAIPIKDFLEQFGILSFTFKQ
jgi:hypothetical protein